MIRILPFLLTCWFFSLAAFGQHGTNPNKVWAFGDSAGVDFTSGTPVGITTSISTWEGSASVCNQATGALLFYTDGRRIWNATGGTMPSASTIVPFLTSSSSQGALIVPFIGDPNKYYVFSLEEVAGSARHCHLSYSVVDMALDGGLGDVVAGSVGIPLDSNMAEKLTAVAGNSCNIWVLAHRRDSTKFMVYEVTSAGLNVVPVVSTVGTRTATGSYGAYGLGCMKVSPDRTKVATGSLNLGAVRACGTELYDFDATTGIVSNVRLLDSTRDGYGIEFSPDSRRLYVGQNAAEVAQYDVSLASTAAMIASRYVVLTGATYPQLKLGPDDKIYLPGTGDTRFLDCINNPDVAGAGCGYAARVVNLAPHRTNIGLPNVVYIVPDFDDTTFTAHDTTLCVPTGGRSTITAHGAGFTFLWTDGPTTRSRSISGYGTYIAVIGNGCSYIIDTITVTAAPVDTVTARHDTSLCGFVTSLTINAPPGHTSYRWEDGTPGTSRTVSASGTYWVLAADTCRNAWVDTFHVVFVPPDTTNNQSFDTTMCITDGSIIFTATAGMGSYTWSTGSTADTIVVATAGTYIAWSVLGCSVTIDTFRLTLVPLPVVNLGNDTTFCIGDSLLLHSPQPAGSNYLWSSGASDTSLLVRGSGIYWLEVDNGYCTSTDTIRVSVAPYPVVDLGPDVLNCTGTPVVLSSSGSFASPTYLWSDGTSAPSVAALVSGTYWLRVTVDNCPAADTVRVQIQVDTFTLYNRDTAICRGQSVQALLTANPDATFQWLPTAGVAASRTASPLITPDTSADYHVRIYLTGCPVREDSFYIEVQPVPVPYFGNNRFVCSNDTLQLAALVNPGWYSDYSYRWRPGADVNDSTAQSVIYTPDGSAMDTTLMELWVSTTAGCAGSVSSKVYVYPGEFATVSNNLSVCPHEEAQFTATGGATYQWSPNLYLDDAQSATPWVRAITSQRYTVLATSPYGCKEQLHVEVVVHPGGLLYLGDSVTLYPGEQYHIKPQTNCTQFEWIPSAGLSSAFVQDPMASPTSSTQYIVTAITEYGCKIVDTLNIRVEADGILDVPNAFAPGGNNKEFKILRKGDATLNYFRVYNRWGNLVFETTDISKGWDGTYKGVPQPMGVFVYDVQAVTSAGTLFSKHGNVTLIR